MIAINMFPSLEQEPRLDACDYDVWFRLGDITILVPGDSHEKRAYWLMGFWEQLTEYMAEYADKGHLIEWVEGGNK